MNILVVGAGPTGLTLANELHRHGVKCRIVDAAPGPCEQSRACGIHARTLETFEMMGIIDKFLAAGNKCQGVVLHNNGKKMIQLTLDELESPYPFVLILPQSETEKLLDQNLTKYGAKVQRNTSLVGLKQSASNVEVKLRTTDGREETSTFDWVIGCDGAHSEVRHALNAPFHGSAYAEGFVLGDVAIEGLARTDMISGYITDDGLVGFFPFGNGRCRVIADTEPKEVSDPNAPTGEAHVKLPPPTMEDIAEIVARRGPNGIKVCDPHWLASFRIHRRQVDSYQHGRVFLAGDAAHIHSPAGGQGMNTGIQDAFNLAWKLALVVKGEAKQALLDSYQTERHAVGQAVLKLTDFLTRINTIKSPIAQALRNRIAPLLAGQEVIQQRMRSEVSETAINYRHSPIVAEHKVSLAHAAAPGRSAEQPEVSEWFDFGHGPHPGDRVPDVHFSDVSGEMYLSLFDLLHTPEHQLFLLTGVRGSSSGNRAVVEIANYVLDHYGDLIKTHIVVPDRAKLDNTEWSGSILVDADLSFHHRFGAGFECLYLIRPDGYVGFRSLPADKLALDEFLARIFVPQ